MPKANLLSFVIRAKTFLAKILRAIPYVKVNLFLISSYFFQNFNELLGNLHNASLVGSFQRYERCIASHHCLLNMQYKFELSPPCLRQ